MLPTEAALLALGELGLCECFPTCTSHPACQELHRETKVAAAVSVMSAWGPSALPGAESEAALDLYTAVAVVRNQL